jgi:hypothetical protein
MLPEPSIARQQPPGHPPYMKWFHQECSTCSTCPHLGVFVEEEEGVGHVVIPQVDHAAAHPATNGVLAAPQDGRHGTTNTRSSLCTAHTYTDCSDRNNSKRKGG